MGRIEREKATIAVMIQIYCHDHHQTTRQCCAECLELLDYAHRRLDTCPFQQKKPACNKCTVHCYSTRMKQRVKQLMRYSGPRMLLRSPYLAILHMLDLLRDVPRLGKRS
jgi:hypothetical protein